MSKLLTTTSSGCLVLVLNRNLVNGHVYKANYPGLPCSFLEFFDTSSEHDRSNVDEEALIAVLRDRCQYLFEGHPDADKLRGKFLASLVELELCMAEDSARLRKKLSI
jgi:hypothetical protein